MRIISNVGRASKHLMRNAAYVVDFAFDAIEAFDEYQIRLKKLRENRKERERHEREE